MLCAGLVAGFLGWAGYFDADVFTLVPAAAAGTRPRANKAVVFLSGDVGYKVALGHRLGDRFSAQGFPVIAINSLGFFRTHRSVENVAALITEAIRRAQRLDHVARVVLVGHSQGADALQAGLAVVPLAQRAAIAGVILIVPTRALYLRISPGEMFDWSEPDAPTIPTLKALDWVPLTCIYGLEESDSPCLLLQGANVQRIGLPGGHALHWDVAAIARASLRSIAAIAAHEK